MVFCYTVERQGSRRCSAQRVAKSNKSELVSLSGAVLVSHTVMGPKKGLSFDEKRDRMLDLFTDTVRLHLASLPCHTAFCAFQLS